MRASLVLICSAPVPMSSPPHRGLPWPHYRTQTMESNNQWWLKTVSSCPVTSIIEHTGRKKTLPDSGSNILCTLFQCRAIYTCWNCQWIWDRELENWFLVRSGDSSQVSSSFFFFPPNLKIKIASWTKSRWCVSQKNEWIWLWKHGIIMPLFSLSLSWHFEANQGLGIG